MIDFPLYGFDFKPYLANESFINETLYDLYAVINHIGNINMGHYVSYIKN